MSSVPARTSDDVLAGAPEAVARRTTPVPVELGRCEAARLTRHPLILVALAYIALVMVLEGDSGPRSAYTLVTDMPAFMLGPFVFFAANLSASRERRHGNEEWLDSMPATSADRTRAAQLAVVGPLVLVTALVLVALAVTLSTDQFISKPPALEVLSGLLPLLGAGLLGVMVARWLPWPGMAALVMVALVATHIALADRLRLLGAFVEWAAWPASDDSSVWAGVIPGSRGWHVIYVLALCAMAAAGAHLGHARRKLPVLALGGAFTAVAVVAGWAQLA
ncbi:MAG: hypothetical protein H0U35_01490 [Sporichthyaceae bacterium]|nr:hypothetical protein [Sporichthyaceae bacterium]